MIGNHIQSTITFPNGCSGVGKSTIGRFLLPLLEYRTGKSCKLEDISYSGNIHYPPWQRICQVFKPKHHPTHKQNMPLISASFARDRDTADVVEWKELGQGCCRLEIAVHPYQYFMRSPGASPAIAKPRTFVQQEYNLGLLTDTDVLDAIVSHNWLLNPLNHKVVCNHGATGMTARKAVLDITNPGPEEAAAEGFKMIETFPRDANGFRVLLEDL